MKQTNTSNVSFLKFFLLSLCLIILTFQVLSASETRINALGNIGSYLRDDSQISVYPSLMNYFSDQICAEIASDSSKYNFSAIIKSNKDYNIGLKINQMDYSDYNLLFNNVIISNTPKRKLDLLIAHKSGIGLGLGLYSDKFEDDAYYYYDEFADNYDIYYDYKKNLKYFEPKISYSSELMDLGLLMPIYYCDEEYKNNNVIQITKKESSLSGLDINFHNRFFIKKNSFDLIPAYSISIKSKETTYKTEGSDVKKIKSTDSFILKCGLAYHKKFNDFVDFTISYNPFNIQNSTYEHKVNSVNPEKSVTKENYTSNSLKIGLESQINKLFCFRLGVVNDNYALDYEYEYFLNNLSKEKDKCSNSKEEYFMYYGFALNYKNITIDALFNEKMLTDGPNLISGETNPLNSKISMTYKF